MLKVTLVQGDITKLTGYDAIVNAANSTLLGGGGVDGCIHRAAGKELLKECMTLGGCPTGGAKTTDAYDLPCKKIIHAVGPIYSKYNPDCAALLYAAYTNCMSEAKKYGLKKIAFPSISTGIYAYPVEEAARIAILAVAQFCENEPEDYEVTWCLFTPEDFDVYKKVLEEIG